MNENLVEILDWLTDLKTKLFVVVWFVEKIY
jgi:hypothetical protein